MLSNLSEVWHTGSSAPSIIDRYQITILSIYWYQHSSTDLLSLTPIIKANTMLAKFKEEQAGNRVEGSSTIK